MTPGSPEPATTEARSWRLWQVETSFACNLACIMCPWRTVRAQTPGSGLMDGSVWAALHPHLAEVEEVDFSGGGEPLLHPDLADWIGEAKRAGCQEATAQTVAASGCSRAISAAFSPRMACQRSQSC